MSDSFFSNSYQNGILSEPIKDPNIQLPVYINPNAIEDSKEIFIETDQKLKDDSKDGSQSQYDQASASTVNSSSENESAYSTHDHNNLGDLNSSNTIQGGNSPDSEGTYETESTHCDTPMIKIDLNLFETESHASDIEETIPVIKDKVPAKRSPKKCSRKSKVCSDSEDEDYLPIKTTKAKAAKSKKSPANPKTKGKEGEKPKKTKKQNKMKNFPGLILQRIKTLILKDSTFGQRFLGRFDVKFHKGIKNLLEKYQKEWKTWRSIKTYLAQDAKYGNYVYEAIFFFLADENKELYEEWINKGKMVDKNKPLAKERREWFAKRFQGLKDGEDIREDDDNISEDPRKLVKL